MPHDNHTEFVSKVLHLVYLHKSASVVDGIQALHNIYFIANKRQNSVHISRMAIREQVKVVLLRLQEVLTCHLSLEKHQHKAELTSLFASKGPLRIYSSPKKLGNKHKIEFTEDSNYNHSTMNIFHSGMVPL